MISKKRNLPLETIPDSDTDSGKKQANKKTNTHAHTHTKQTQNKTQKPTAHLLYCCSALFYHTPYYQWCLHHVSIPVFATSYAMISSSQCSYLANPLHAFIHIYSGSDCFCCFSPSSFQFISISLLMATSHPQQPSKIFSHLTEDTVLHKIVSMLTACQPSPSQACSETFPSEATLF